MIIFLTRFLIEFSRFSTSKSIDFGLHFIPSGHLLLKMQMLKKCWFSLGKTTIFKGRRIKEKNAHQQKTATKIIVFLLFFGPKTISKAIPNSNGTENRRKSHPAPFPNALFRPRVRFLAILGSSWEPKIMKNAFENESEKMAEKKNDNMRWDGVMRWASGR